MNASDTIALLGVGITFAGLGLAVLALDRGNKNASASTLVSLHEAIRQAWERFLSPPPPSDKNYQFAELANLLEISCALCTKRIFSGVAKKLLTTYLIEVFSLFNSNEYCKERLVLLQKKETTFINILAFLKKHHCKIFNNS